MSQNTPQPAVPPELAIKTIEREIRPSIAGRVLGLIVLAGVVLVFVFGTDRSTVFEWLREAGPIPFFAALAVLPVVGFPTTPLFALSGAVFGTATALIGTACSITVHLMLCFWVTRSGLKPWLLRRLARTRYSLPDLSGSRSGAWRFAVLVHLAPGLPTFAKNYAVALSGTPFAVYFIVAMSFTGSYAAALIVLGDSIFDREIGTVVLMVALLAVAAAVLVWFRVRRARRRRVFADKTQSTKESA